MKDIYLDTYSFHLASDVWTPHPGEPRDIFWVLEKARAMGFNGLHTADMGHFNEVITVKALVDAMEGMTLSLGTGGCDPEHMYQMLDLCTELGHPLFRTFLGSEITSEKISNLHEVAVAAEQADIIIAIENHQDLTSHELLEIIDQVGSSHLGVCLDLGNGLGVFEDPMAVCENLAHVTFTTHVKEYTVYPARMGYVFWSVPVGTGACRVRDQLELLFEESPWGHDLPLNLETALEFIDHSEANAVQVLDDLPRLSSDPPPAFMQWAPEQALAAEQLLIRDSLEGLRHILNQVI